MAQNLNQFPVMEENMRILIILFAIAVAVAILVVFPNSAMTQNNCKWKMTQTQAGMPGPPYRACGLEMTTTFSYTKGDNGVNPVHCQVINGGYDAIYWAATAPTPGPIVEHTDCPTVENHQLLIEYQVHIPPIWGFRNISLTAEYSTGAPEGPQGP